MNIVNVTVVFQASDEDKTTTTFELVELLVSVGSKVVEHDVLAVAETEKAAIEIESPVDGEVVELLLQAGQTYNHGAVLCKIKTN
jgi:pyruvate/2-oxoglutarate dehydrogenase complex dihydrolipoamide acyltransferase (E2) component